MKTRSVTVVLGGWTYVGRRPMPTDVPQVIKAYDGAPGLVVHRALRPERDRWVATGREWVVTHEPSGMAVAVSCRTRREALELARALAALDIDWTRPREEIRARWAQDPELAERVRDVVWGGKRPRGEVP